MSNYDAIETARIFDENNVKFGARLGLIADNFKINKEAVIRFKESGGNFDKYNIKYGVKTK